MPTHKAIIAKQRAEREDRKRRQNQDADAATALMDRVKQLMRPAMADDWRAFLSARTAPCTHFYDYDFPSCRFFLAHVPVVIPSAFGAQAINVIAMPGVEVAKTPGWTHCNIFRMDAPDAAGMWVPSYNDANQG